MGSHCLWQEIHSNKTGPNQPTRGCFGPVLIEFRKKPPEVCIRITDVQTGWNEPLTDVSNPVGEKRKECCWSTSVRSSVYVNTGSCLCGGTGVCFISTNHAGSLGTRTPIWDDLTVILRGTPSQKAPNGRFWAFR
jgi:hypothetical protein